MIYGAKPMIHYAHYFNKIQPWCSRTPKTFSVCIFKRAEKPPPLRVETPLPTTAAAVARTGKKCNKVKVMPRSSTEHLLDHEARRAVEEEGEERCETEEEEGFEDRPAVLMPDDVSDRLERVAEPDE